MNLAKADLLSEAADEIRKCQKCLLWKSRLNPVPGEGKIDSKVMLIGEAPGFHEDQQGRPFVGAAGKFLDELLAQADLSREEAYITNIVKCRPQKNREPVPDEIKACTPFLDRQIECISPKVTITLGSHAAACVLPKYGVHFEGITKIHGIFYEISTSVTKIIVPMFHPASALYNPAYKEALMKDFKSLKFRLKELL